MEYFFIWKVHSDGSLNVVSHKNSKTRLLIAKQLKGSDELSVIADQNGTICNEKYKIKDILPSNFYLSPYSDGAYPLVVDRNQQTDEYELGHLLYDMLDVMQDFDNEKHILQEKTIIGVDKI